MYASETTNQNMQTIHLMALIVTTDYLAKLKISFLNKNVASKLKL